MNRYATQGALIVEALKARPHTHMEMLGLGVSTCPWKRVSEWFDAHNFPPRWKLQKGRKYLGEGRYVTTWRVVRA